MKISKQLLLEKIEALRFANYEALESEDTSDEVYAQEEAIRDTYDLVEMMIKKLGEDDAPKEVKPCTAGAVKEHIKGYSDDANIIAIIWGESDVRSMNKDDEGNSELDDDFQGTPLTEKQVIDVLSMLDRNHDACYGINWEKIEAEVEWIKDNS